MILKPNTRALAVNMGGVDRWTVGIMLKPLSGWSLQLLPAKEGSRNSKMLVPWDF